MANEAFALSPISARAASPSDADFEAIRDAFLETARGRWFLDEYTKRNRNADTAMVLEAVARIEQSLAAQKEEASPPVSNDPTPSEVPPSELPEAMAAVKLIVAAARESAAMAMAGPILEEALAPSRKCARVIREIAWGLRESGADGRICSLLESQVDAINAACDNVVASGLRDEILQAFDQAAQQIDGIGSATAPLDEPVAAIQSVDFTSAEPSEETRAVAVNDSSFEMAATVTEISATETMVEAASPVDVSLPVETVAASVAMDIAPEPRRTVHLEIVPDTRVEPVAAIVPQPVAAAPLSTLGESLIANGIVAKPASSRSDPLAPIRRMSQAEKIAFFS